MLREPELEPLADAPDDDGDPDGLLSAAAKAALQESEHSGAAMVALYPDATTATEVALAGGEDPDDLHVTLAFIGKIASLSREDALRAVRAWAAACPPLKGEISGVGKFVGGPDPVTYLSVDLPELPHRREELVNLLDGEGVCPKKDHGFTPHMTLDYASRRPKVESAIPLTFTHATLSWGDERIDVPFTGTAKLEESLVQHAETELEKAGLNSPESDYGGMLGNEILRIVRTFSEGGHSGGSAMMTIAALEKLLRFEPLTPLTSDPDEWMHIADERTNGEDLWQNRRHPAAFSEDGGKTWKIMEAANLLEGKWNPSLHPRWPKGTPRAGEFMQVGQRFVGADGKEWQIAHIVKGKVIAHRAEGKLDQTETGVFHPKKEKLKDGTEHHVIPEAKKEAAPRLVKGGKGAKANVTTVDAYVDSASHNTDLPVPQDSKISEKEWERFGEIDQEHYGELMGRFGKYSPSKAKALIDESYQDYEAEVQAIVKNAYSSQYGSSTGHTLSLTNIFQKITGKQKADLAKVDAQRQRALELQGRHKDVIAWDLYNRTHSPDIAVFHKSSDGPSYWNEFIAGNRPVMSGLSQSFNFGANFQFGNNTLATPLAIRNILMSSYSAQPIPGSTHFPGELEVSTAEQLKLDDRSITFSLHEITANQKKWLMGITKAPTSGAAIERFKEALQSGEMLPTPPAPPDIQMAGEGQKLWIDPPVEAAEFAKDFAAKLPAISSNAHNPADLDKKGPWANKDAAGNPMATVAKESELKPGDYMMGLKGTLYLIVEDPGDETGFGLRYVKIENGVFTGESYNFEGGGKNQYFKLSTHFDLPDPHKEEKATDLFDPHAWVNGDKEEFTGKLEKGEKFKVNGNPYEVIAQINGAQAQIKDLVSGKVGTINTDYKTPVLVTKDGYVPPTPGEESGLTPQKGMTFAHASTKHTITNILKDGTVKARPTGGGKTVAISPDDDDFKTLYDPKAHKIGAKIAAGDLKQGDLFHGGRGSTQRPYVVTGAEGNKVTWRSLDTGEDGVFTKAKIVRTLDDVDATADPDAPANTPTPAETPPAFNPDEWTPAAELPVGDLTAENKFAWNGKPYEVIGGGTNQQTEVKDLTTGKTHAFTDDITVTHLIPKTDIEPDELDAVAEDVDLQGKLVNLGHLKPGDIFGVDGEHFAVTFQGATLEDNSGVVPILPSGAFGAETTEGTFPGKVVTYKGNLDTHSPKEFAQTETPSSSGMADLEMEGGFQGYKSKYGSGGTYTHDKLSEMMVGTVFQDKTGKLWSIKANDASLIVTDGQTLYQADGSLRGKVTTAEFVDATGPLPGPTTTAAEAEAAADLTDNWPGLKMADLPIGAKALIDGKVHTIIGFEGPNNLTAKTNLPDGSLGLANGAAIPDKVASPAQNHTVGNLEPNAPFWMDGSSHSVVAQSIDGTVIKSDDTGEMKKVPSNTAFQKWGTPSLEGEASPKEKKVSDLSKGELFEGAGGTPHEVVAVTVDGKVVVRQGADNLAMVPPSTPLNHVNGKMKDGLDPVATGALTPASGDSEWTPAVQSQLDQAGAVMDDVPTLNLNGFKSKWGSGGKYQHNRIEEFLPGATFLDKSGLVYHFIGHGPNNNALVKDEEGQLHLVSEETRVKLYSGSAFLAG